MSFLFSNWFDVCFPCLVVCDSSCLVNRGLVSSFCHCLQLQDFKDGKLDTGFIVKHEDELKEVCVLAHDTGLEFIKLRKE